MVRLSKFALVGKQEAKNHIKAWIFRLCSLGKIRYRAQMQILRILNEVDVPLAKKKFSGLALLKSRTQEVLNS